MINFDEWYSVCNIQNMDEPLEVKCFLAWSTAEEQSNQIIHHYKKLLDIANQKIEELERSNV